MAAPKGMRWNTARGVVAGVLETHIAQQSEELSNAGAFLRLLRRLEPGGPSREVGHGHLVAVPGFGKNGSVQPGSIPDRVLEIVGEFDGPVQMSQIVDAKHGAKVNSVQLAVRALVRSGHLLATGATSTRRYSLPQKKKGRVAV